MQNQTDYETSARVAWTVPEWGARYGMSRTAAFRLFKEGKGPATTQIPGTTKRVITVEADEAWRQHLNAQAGAA